MYEIVIIMRLKSLWFVVFMFLAVFQVMGAAKQADTTALKKGDKCPEFVFKDAQGKDHRLSELKGKYVFIDVWASWCYPCRKEYPYLQELEEKMEGKNIVFVGISCDHVEWRGRELWGCERHSVVDCGRRVISKGISGGSDSPFYIA